MENFKILEDELYLSQYGLPRKGNYEEIWNKIKTNKNILKEALEVRKDKFCERDLVKGLAICDSILVNYKDVDSEIYQNLVDLIYSNEQIARIVLDGYANGGYSYLLMTLWNHNLKLTEEQKAFAVKEAMNKMGTTRYEKLKELWSNELDKKGISDEQITYINIDGSINPIGAKTATEYFRLMFDSLSDTQAHGQGDFDIRYNILRNPNWTLEEKSKLIYEFYSDDEVYDERLEQWEWNVVNDEANYKGETLPQFDKYELFNEWSYEMLLGFYEDKETTDRIWEEMEFCKQMHKLRPQQWELEYKKIKKY